MALKEAIFDRAKAVAGLTALIGSGDNCRLYYGEAEGKPTAPYAVYFQVGDENHHLSGADAGIVSARIQFNAYADTQDGAYAVGEQIVAAFSRYGGTHAGVVIQHGFVENRFDSVDDETKLKVRVTDMIFWYEGT